MTAPSEISCALWLFQSSPSHLLFGFPIQILILPFFVLILICAIWLASFFPRSRSLRLKGMELASKGFPADAEACFRKLLARDEQMPSSDRVRVLVSLADVLIDRCRYQEARDTLNKALVLGDPTGGANSSLAQSYLLEGNEPEVALEMVHKAMDLYTEHPPGKFPYDWGERFGNLTRSGFLAQKAWALAQLKRYPEAQQAAEESVQALDAAQAGEPNYSKTAPVFGPDFRTVLKLGVAETHWRLAMAMYAMRGTRQAAVHLESALKADPKGKYGLLAAEQIKHATAEATY
jgi:tetratricopeptide (TPR) repeat protein